MEREGKKKRKKHNYKRSEREGGCNRRCQENRKGDKGENEHQGGKENKGGKGGKKGDGDCEVKVTEKEVEDYK